MKIKYIILIMALLTFSSSCNEDKWLKEEPKSFYTPENSYKVEADFNAAVAYLYSQLGSYLYDLKESAQRAMHYPTDVMKDAIAPEHELNYYSDKLFPERGEAKDMWQNMYKMIFNANVIIERIELEGVEISDETTKKNFIAEAKFFRAFGYKVLTILYGDVPLVLEEIKGAKRDFTRAPKSEVINQIIADLIYAQENLPQIDEIREEGRISKSVASHMLSEVYIINKEYDKAIAAADLVINNPNFHLMKNRFGSRANEEGDVYWDLFRRNNQNRSSGNMEALYVHQFEYQKDGGSFSMSWPRWLNPMYWQLTDPNNVNLFIGPSAHNGGRGIGWYAANNYIVNTVWENTGDDMRNSKFNIRRDIKSDNPASEYYGKYIVESGALKKFNNANDRFWNAQFIKTMPIDNFPSEAIANATTGLVNNNANQTFTDFYIFRLAETYLLRAEAKVGKGDLAGAADDINIVRDRVNATKVTDAEMTLDFILDERARELAFEELRLLTLMRTGKLVERVRKYNDVSKDKMGDHQNLWPIPQSEIETNTEATLTQNPGY